MTMPAVQMILMMTTPTKLQLGLTKFVSRITQEAESECQFNDDEYDNCDDETSIWLALLEIRK